MPSQVLRLLPLAPALHLSAAPCPISGSHLPARPTMATSCWSRTSGASACSMICACTDHQPVTMSLPAFPCSYELLVQEIKGARVQQKVLAKVVAELSRNASLQVRGSQAAGGLGCDRPAALSVLVLSSAAAGLPRSVQRRSSDMGLRRCD